ncbi:MAG: hypothetical protein NTY50_22765, partial [Methylobacter sp.]|nr:hypothetical protein [Methylobacter sp.]
NWLPLGNCSCIALLTYIHVGILLDDCMDAGGRAMHGAVAERVGVRRIKYSSYLMQVSNS